MSKTVIITGATRGLGYSLSRLFGEAGYTVHGISLTKKSWKRAQADFPASGKLLLYQADLTRESDIRSFAKAFKKKKEPADILINNAGYGGRLALVQDLSLSEYDKFMNINLKSAFLMSKYFLPHFRKKGSGLIINVSSMAGLRAVPKLFGYSASKFGMRALTECIAKENADTALRCITVSPGGMNTEMRAQLFGREDASKQQSADFVARIIIDIAEQRFPVASGSDVAVRHGKIWSVQPLPAA